MSKSDWGIKRVCNNGTCGAKFYDFYEKVITCPKCGGAYSQKLSSRSFADYRLVASDDAIDSPAPAEEGEVVEGGTSDSISGEDVAEVASLEDSDEL